MFRTAFAALSTAVLLSASPILAQETVEPVLGEYLQPLGLGPFQDATWTGFEQEGWFVLQNTTQPTAIRYYEMPLMNADGTLTLRANVYARNDDGEGVAATGLLYDFGDEHSTYIAFLLNADNQLMAINRDVEGMDVIYGDEDDPVGRGDGSDVLEVRISGTQARMYLNDQLFRNYDLTHRPFRDRAGIIAVGTGRLGFWGLSAQ
ncbi:hypothetical protein [Nioella ostreopsis]|uniref:hypothetical protein n=1 Tax=Nioella ostreopsis TaxID=2448479 RepID=UPI000FDBF313|nr:hypothetical protein [Nioella ostreopsis]